MATIKVGDYVRRSAQRPRFILGTRAHKVTQISSSGDWMHLEGFENKSFACRFFEIVSSPSADIEPKAAEEGTFLIVKMDRDGDTPCFIYTKRHKHWVDAEQAAQEMLHNDPEQATYGVLKLVGTVSMQPTWS